MKLFSKPFGKGSSASQPNTIELQGFDVNGISVYHHVLSISEFPNAKYLWEDAELIRSHGITRLFGTLHDEHGQMEQEYERHYDANGNYLEGTIRYADGRTIRSNTAQLEPSTIAHGKFIFTVHYLHNTSQPKAPKWFAFTLVAYDQLRRVYPAEIFQILGDQQPPAIDGAGTTNIEAYFDVRAKLLALVPGD